MAKRSPVHPKAYLTSRRNVKAGLLARTKILLVLERERKTAPQIVKETGLSYASISYHLKALKKDRLADRLSNTRPFAWGLTPFGQQKLPSQ
jgi:DNA-binding transcriptional ArsR family regulator